uniref:Fibronectin type-III domain-containing protein n=1 Tax=Panagrellus redivivus TaxID=6233 RepID=A0A7E4ZRT4_PANRE
MFLKLRQSSSPGGSNRLLPQPSAEDSLSLNSLHQDVPPTALISGVTTVSSLLQNGTCCSAHRASLIEAGTRSSIGEQHSPSAGLHGHAGLHLPLISADDMCGIMQSGICRFSELTPGQFGLTKQLVLRIALPHITLLIVSILYAVVGCGILTFINYHDTSADVATELIINTKVLYVERLMSVYDNEKAALANMPTNDGQAGTSDAFNISNSLDMNRFKAIENKLDEQWFFEFAEELNSVYNQYSKAGAIIRSVHVSFTLDKCRCYLFWFKHNDDSIRSDPFANITWNLFFAATTLTSIGYGTNAPETVIGRVFCLVYISIGIPLYLITMADLAKFCTEGMNRIYTEFLKYKYQIVRRYRRWRKKGRFRSNSVRIGEVIIAGGEDEVAEFIWTHLENTQFVEIPFLLIYALLLAYVYAASYAIAWMEDWTIYNAFYFLCSSVLTIGFGDLVPLNDKFVLVTLCLVLFGLVLTTTCVDIVGAYYIDQLHFFGRRLDSEDPLIWLKAVQQKRIEAMKREAMRKLFETVTALHHMRFGGFSKLDSSASSTTEVNEYRCPEPPNPPRNIVAFNATAESVCLKWDPPIFLEEGKRYWYTLTFKTRTPQRRNHLTVIDFITTDHYEVTNLKTFTLYEFSLATTTRFGSSKAIKTQEYTEPCTVPTSVVIDAVSSETATIAWRAPKKNNGSESYVVQFAAEPAPAFQYWQRYKVGKAKRFTITNLSPDTNYIACVSAEHNFGLAAMSKSIRFKTRAWFYDEEIFNPRMHMLSPIPPALYTLGQSASRQKLSVSSHESIR